jgi:ABC-type sugar transport system ATPase subunit
MHEGRIVAKGDPGELFENPPSIEVAQVISDPPISICAGEVKNGHLYFNDGSAVDETSLLLGADGPVRIGIRPDALTIGGDIPAQVTLAEFSGSDTIVHLRLPFGEAVMLVDGIREYSPGVKFGVSLETSALLLFSQAGGNITERTG